MRSITLLLITILSFNTFSEECPNLPEHMNIQTKTCLLELPSGPLTIKIEVPNLQELRNCQVFGYYSGWELESDQKVKISYIDKNLNVTNSTEASKLIYRVNENKHAVVFFKDFSKKIHGLNVAGYFYVNTINKNQLLINTFNSSKNTSIDCL